MDNGEVIVGLNETWTFVGATIFEWGSGFLVFIMASELVDKPGRSMPFLLSVLLLTTLTLAASRRAFPDEEVGLRNWLMVFFGIPPLNLPPPSCLQPFWSGAPTRELSEKAHFMNLGLDAVFEAPRDEIDEAEAFYLGQNNLDMRFTQMKEAGNE